jgi:hypothetical protein
MFIMGGIFILVTVVCSDGLAGLLESHGGRAWHWLKTHTGLDKLLPSTELKLEKELS